MLLDLRLYLYLCRIPVVMQLWARQATGSAAPIPPSQWDGFSLGARQFHLARNCLKMLRNVTTNSISLEMLRNVKPTPSHSKLSRNVTQCNNQFHLTRNCLEMLRNVTTNSISLGLSGNVTKCNNQFHLTQNCLEMLQNVTTNSISLKIVKKCYEM